MNSNEAYEAMRNGEKIIHEHFSSKQYLYMDNNEIIRDEDEYSWSERGPFELTAWEEYTKNNKENWNIWKEPLQKDGDLDRIISKLNIGEEAIKFINNLENAYNFIAENDDYNKTMVEYINYTYEYIKKDFTEEQIFLMGIGSICKLISERLEIEDDK